MRDLGGLRTRDGGETARGAVVRSGSPDGLSERGWEALRAYGIRTIVDLRNDDEQPAARRTGVERLHLPLDGVEDTDFWDRWASGPEFGTPLYYLPHLRRFPDRNARVIEAIARAEPGGVLVPLRRRPRPHRPDHTAAAGAGRGRARADRGRLLPEPGRGGRLPGGPRQLVDGGGPGGPGRARRRGLPARGGGQRGRPRRGAGPAARECGPRNPAISRKVGPTLTGSASRRWGVLRRWGRCAGATGALGATRAPRSAASRTPPLRPG